MRKFAKLFEFDDVGQVVVLRQEDGESAPSLKVMTSQGEGIGSFEISFSDDEEGIRRRDAAFDGMTDEKAREFPRLIREAALGPDAEVPE